MTTVPFEQGPIRPPSEAYSLLYLALPKEGKNNFRLGRRAGVYQSVEDLSKPELRNQVERALKQIETERPGGIEKALSDLVESFI